MNFSRNSSPSTLSPLDKAVHLIMLMPCPPGSAAAPPKLNSAPVKKAQSTCTGILAVAGTNPDQADHIAHIIMWASLAVKHPGTGEPS
jgi:hypothetical protein